MDAVKTDLRNLERHLSASFGKNAPRSVAATQEYDRFAQFDDALGSYAEGMMNVHEGAAPAEPPKVAEKIVQTRGMGGAWSNG